MTGDDDLARRVARALQGLSRPDESVNILEAGLVHDLMVHTDGEVRFELHLRPGDPSDLASEARQAVASVDGVETVRVEVRARSADGQGEDDPAGEEEGAEPRPREPTGRSLPVMGQGAGASARDAGGDGPGGEGGPRPVSADREAASRHPSEAPALPGVGHVVAVSSGKGGVGKSTVATNLAAAWADEGHRVGLLDADVYGPDIPTMFGVHERPRMEDDEVVPLEAHGVKLMSIGFIVEEDTPAIWRGPIIQGIVRQFLQQVRWGELDFLVVDLPPGTGDAQLSLVQLVQVDGGVFVTTPQDVAVGGVLKGVKMFERLEIPVVGLVENMRGFVCPGCGERHDIFGSGGGEKLAGSLELPFLGSIPLGTAVREEGDRGLPTVLGRPDSPEAAAMRDVAAAARERIEALSRRREEAGRGAGDGATDAVDR